MRRIMVAAIAALALAGSAFAQWAGPGMGPFGNPLHRGVGGPFGGMGLGLSGMGFVDYERLNLTGEQRAHIAGIEQALWRTQWELMGDMFERGFTMHGARGGVPPLTYEQMAALRRQMFDAHQDAQRRIEAVLTDEQRAQLRVMLGCGP